MTIEELWQKFLSGTNFRETMKPQQLRGMRVLFFSGCTHLLAEMRTVSQQGLESQAEWVAAVQQELQEFFNSDPRTT